VELEIVVLHEISKSHKDKRRKSTKGRGKRGSEIRKRQRGNEYDESILYPCSRSVIKKPLAQLTYTNKKLKKPEGTFKRLSCM
jgi:hypothetical protein